MVDLKKLLCFFVIISFVFVSWKKEKDINMRFDFRAITECTQLLDELSKDEPISINGTGGWFYDNEIHYVTLMLRYDKNVDLSTARKITVCLSKRMVDRLNQNEDLKKYIKNKKFTTENVRISLDFFGESRIDPDHIADVSLIGKNVFFQQQLKPGLFERETVLKESWEEAIAAVESSES